jgi:hypothetical protein
VAQRRVSRQAVTVQSHALQAQGFRLSSPPPSAAGDEAVDVPPMEHALQVRGAQLLGAAQQDELLSGGGLSAIMRSTLAHDSVGTALDVAEMNAGQPTGVLRSQRGLRVACDAQRRCCRLPLRLGVDCASQARSRPMWPPRSASMRKERIAAAAAPAGRCRQRTRAAARCVDCTRSRAPLRKVSGKEEQCRSPLAHTAL